ncbi:MAG TPA: PP2C family protein-serine/threonine phosphatase [Thermoanaerobaculia bacterium]|jgi:serine phosphatase RsbU (regulator of sigma subunit)
MPTGRDWIDLLRTTFKTVGREDLSGLYSLEWKRAKEKLTAEDQDSIARETHRLRRFLKSANSVLFGLSKRLAPARRVLFLAVLAFFLLSIFGSSFEHRTEKVKNGVRRTVDYRVDLDSGFLAWASALLVLLLAMELVDKINYRDELDLARELQSTLIPHELPKAATLELGASNMIANLVGGDIYDFVPLPDTRLAVLFGDASGHGMAAGLVMAVAHAAFRTQLDVDPTPRAMFATLNRILCRTGSPRAFFGCVYLLLSHDGAFSGSVAGHPPPLRVGPDGGVRERIGRGAYPLGIKTEISWPAENGRLEPGEILFLHSDGLSEARDASGMEFGDARIEAAVRRGIYLAAPELAAAIAAEVRYFCGRRAPEDDVSIAVIRRTA